MAKTSTIERDKKRRRLAKKYKVRRTRLKTIAAANSPGARAATLASGACRASRCAISEARD